MYHVKYTDKVIKTLKKIDRSVLILVKTWIEKILKDVMIQEFTVSLLWRIEKDSGVIE